MGFFGRLTKVLQSNLNDLINRSEDPEKMLGQILVDMREQLLEAKKQVAVAIADEKKLGKRAQREVDSAKEWENKAMLAVRASDDELAKQALARKREHEGLATAYNEQWEKQKASVEQLKLALRVLNSKIEEAKRKKEVLIARKRRAEAMQSIQQTMSGLNDASAFETFDRLAGKIDQLEAETEATAEMNEESTGDVLKHKFDQLETTAVADQELEALKAKMGLGAPAPTAPQPSPEASEEEAEMAELEAALAELKAREGV